MIQYPGKLQLVNAINYGVVKTETVFGFGRLNQSEVLDSNSGTTEPFSWELNAGENKGRSFNENEYSQSPRSNKRKHIPITKQNKVADDTVGTVSEQGHRRAKTKGVKKCIFNILKAEKGRKKKKGKISSVISKFITPLILGILAAKSLLIPIAFKVLALLAAKGLLMGLFASIMASIFGLRSMFHSQNYQRRKYDSQSKVESVQTPYSSYEHYYDEHYYDDDYYRREDNVPEVPYALLTPPDELQMNRRKKH